MTNDSAKPIKQDDFDRPKPISDARLSALEELSALDQDLELTYGLTGNPMIKVQDTMPVAWALIATEGAIAGDVLAVTTTRELAFRKFVDSHQPCRIVPLVVAPAEDAIAGRKGD